mgnify:CR=1 FL=1
MRIVGVYSFKGGKEYVESNYPALLREIRDVIESVDAAVCRTKISKEKTMSGKMLYSPRSFNALFTAEFKMRDWTNQKVRCDYHTSFYSPDYKPQALVKGAYRDMDFVKGRLGVEVQFGKYAFMVYNVCAKMTIFHKLGFIDAGVEMVAVKELAHQMSTGVSYYEQFVWDLEQRGVADIDIPVLILGVACD